jgi:hypothetical protein
MATSPKAATKKKAAASPVPVPTPATTAQTPDRATLLAAQQQLLAIKKTLQDGLGALKPIEAQLKAALKALDATTALATATKPDMMPLFEQLLAATRQEGDHGFAAIKATVTNADALALADELGLTLKSKSLREIWRLLRLRVQQSLQLTVVKPQTGPTDGL